MPLGLAPPTLPQLCHGSRFALGRCSSEHQRLRNEVLRGLGVSPVVFVVFK